MSKTLVIILSETRAHELTFDMFKKNVIDELNADLCLCIGVKPDYDYENPFYKLSKYNFVYNEPEDFGDAFEYAYNILSQNKPKYECLQNINALHGKIQKPQQYTDNIKYYGKMENTTNFDNFNDDEIVVHTKDFPDNLWKNKVYGIVKSENNNLISQKNVITYKKHLYWREFLKIKNQFLGGIKDKDNQHPGSAGILIFFRWFLLKNLIDNDLINKYDRFIITRSDFIYQLPYPKVGLMNEKYIWIPDCEHYGGYTDRHVVLSKNNIEPYLNILNNLVLKSNRYFMKMKHKKDWNLEQLIKFHLAQTNVLDLVKEFPYIMYSVRNINGSTRWSKGNLSNEFDYYIKYKSEYAKSTYYKNEFDKSGTNIDKFYSKFYTKKFNLLHFIPYNKNFGDELNVHLINRLVKILNLNIKINFINLSQTQIYDKTLKTFSFLGSIMHSLPPNVDVIGTGVNPNYNNICNSLNIISLRGELSKNYLIKEHGYKIGDIVFGDPALLIPRLFPEWLEPLPMYNNCEIGLIPHFNDIPHVKEYINTFNNLNIEICYPNQDALTVINFIRTKKTIISSSLHGIIVAEMLNKNVKWIMYDASLASEGEHKYLEYFNSTGRYNIKYSTQISEALISTLPKPTYNDSKLFNLIKKYFTE